MTDTLFFIRFLKCEQTARTCKKRFSYLEVFTEPSKIVCPKGWFLQIGSHLVMPVPDKILYGSEFFLDSILYYRILQLNLKDFQIGIKMME